MLSTLKYEVVKREPQTNAKITKLINPILKKENTLMGVFFDLRTNEDFTFMCKLFKSRYNLKNIKGVQIPFHNLPIFLGGTLKTLPQNNFIISDISTEVFFFRNLKEAKKEFYYTYNLFPPDVKHKMRSVQNERSFGGKVNMHRQIWSEIIDNKKILLQLISNAVSSQMAFRLDMISIPTPMIVDREHLELVESCYQNAMNLYHGEYLDIEKEQGRILALYLNIHKHFLLNSGNVREFLISVRRLKPKAVIFKITGLEDIREEPKIIDNWKILVKGLGMMSDEDAFPIIYLSTSTEGLISQAYGIDSFTQSFYKLDNIEKKVVLPRETMQMLWRDNPKLSSGKISLYHEKEFIKRLEFEKLIRVSGIPYPMSELSITPERICSMSPNSFREFSKLVLSIQRNLEIQETIDSINNGNIRILRSKFKKWMKDLNLFP